MTFYGSRGKWTEEDLLKAVETVLNKKKIFSANFQYKKKDNLGDLLHIAMIKLHFFPLFNNHYLYLCKFIFWITPQL